MDPVCENVNLIQSLESDFVGNESLVSVINILIIKKINVLLWIVINIL
jgi:hypothetical protein